MSAHVATRSESEVLSRDVEANRFLAQGLPALIIGGGLLIAVVWWLTLHLAGVLAVSHVERKMADVAAKARMVLTQPLDEGAQRDALAWLARFRDVQRLELRGEDGTLLWRNHHSVSQVHHALPAAGATLLERRIIDGLARDVARHHALVKVQGRPVHLVLEADVTDMLASYRQVAVLVAKALSTALLAAIFLMGWMLILRWREQRALAAQLRQLLEEAAQGESWHEAVSRMNSRNAALLRRMLELAERNVGAGGEETSESDALRSHRKRA